MWLQAASDELCLVSHTTIKNHARSLCIKGPRDDPSGAIAQLRSHALAFCFEIECRFDLTIELAQSTANIDTEFEDEEFDSYDFSDSFLPRNRYDQNVLGLYLEGRQAVSTTAQFLAYYQVLEYFYADAIQREAIDKVENLLKDAQLPYGSRRQARALVLAAQATGGSVPERDQLKALLRRLVSSADLLQFIDSRDASLRRALTAKEPRAKGVEPIKLSPDNGNLLADFANRIYAIRNRIVHAKSSDEFKEAPPLWPGTPEVQLIAADVAVVRFLARRTLSLNSEPLYTNAPSNL